ncbi:MAG: carboxymuconolactone decarboxylase [Candidatus Rokuibacteriota bacterium]|jgi:alkylhydroperoxidase/carboxymuconolactone decarboxylase family protein YurZ|nr:MAG: carboxymuconolactone decarboxylase [Candidatus Rokubacteria bacterium]
MPGPDHATRSSAALPARQLGEAELAALRAPYTELIGFVPPRIQARTELGSRLDPELLRLQEAARLRAMNPACFDVKTSQLMLFGILLALMGDAARLHAIAARRAGASWEELHAVVGLAYLFRGMPAANLGAEVLLKMAEAEGHSAPA